MIEIQWPDQWQPEAIEVAAPLVGADSRVEVIVGPPETSVDGTVIAGYLYAGEDGEVMVIHDRSGRPDVYPWRMLQGPVLRITLRPPRRPRQVVFSHPAWLPRTER